MADPLRVLHGALALPLPPDPAYEAAIARRQEILAAARVLERVGVGLDWAVRPEERDEVFEGLYQMLLAASEIRTGLFDNAGAMCMVGAARVARRLGWHEEAVGMCDRARMQSDSLIVAEHVESVLAGEGPSRG